MQKLKNAHVVIFGLGGVGSYVCEALCRAGIGKLSLIDADSIDETNINRQLYALSSTVGKPKTELAKARCLDINENVDIACYPEFVTAETTEALFERIDSSALGHPDFVIDAIDTVSAKLAIAQYCEDNNIRLISCCGTGNKLSPELFRIDDIYKTSVCPLCKVLRRELKKREVKALTVCWSPEEPIKTGSRTPASISFVPSTAGLLIASYVVKELI